jgi:hypothetical protein
MWRIPAPDACGEGVRVWLFAWPSEPSESDRQAWWDLLDESERVRCSGIGTGTGQIRFAASHAGARALVPRSQTWREGHASLSHTATMAAVACADVRLGIDVEADVPRPMWSRADRQQWPDSPSGTWSVFIERWVEYEAWFKCGIEDGVGSRAVGNVRGLAGLPDHILAMVLEPAPNHRATKFATARRPVDSSTRPLGSNDSESNGPTGTNRARPGLDQALAAVRTGDTLVVPNSTA